MQFFIAQYLVEDCPHCKATHAAMQMQFHYLSNVDSSQAWCVFACPVCWGAVLAKISVRQDKKLKEHVGDIRTAPTHFRVDCVYPAQQSQDLPEHLPSRVAELFRQSLNALARGDFDAAGMVLRKCLETAIKMIDEGGRGTPKERIDALASKGLLPPAMRDWAHHIRLLGNEFTHEETPTQGDVRQTAEFLHLFLLYAFSLPEMVRSHRAEPLAQPSES